MPRKRLNRNIRPAGRALAGFFGSAILAWSSLVQSEVLDGDQILQRTRAAYPALQSYSDSATILNESQLPGGPLLLERHSFTTVFRAPRDFLLDFREDPEAGADHYVLRSDASAIYTWWSATGVSETFPPGTGLSAFAISAFPTKSAVVQILPLIFADAGLNGPITEVATATLDGEEEIDGHLCYRLQGLGRSAFATGGGETFRPTTLWIDQQSFLVRKVFQDTRQGGLAGLIDRQTTTYKPVANPDLSDDAFRFTPPTTGN